MKKVVKVELELDEETIKDYQGLADKWSGRTTKELMGEVLKGEYEELVKLVQRTRATTEEPYKSGHSPKYSFNTVPVKSIEALEKLQLKDLPANEIIRLDMLSKQRGPTTIGRVFLQEKEKWLNEARLERQGFIIKNYLERRKG